jgi:hypothetical protein
MKAQDVLEEAAEIVGGQRATDYGPKLLNHQRIAALWNLWLSNTKAGATVDDWTVDAYDVAMMMMMVKIARLMNSPGHGDSHLDIAGYSAIAKEIWDQQEAEDKKIDALIRTAVMGGPNEHV